MGALEKSSILREQNFEGRIKEIVNLLTLWHGIARRWHVNKQTSVLILNLESQTHAIKKVVWIMENRKGCWEKTLRGVTERKEVCSRAKSDIERDARDAGLKF